MSDVNVLAAELVVNEKNAEIAVYNFTKTVLEAGEKLEKINRQRINKGSLFDADTFANLDKNLKSTRDVMAEIAKNSEYKGNGLQWVRDSSITAKKEILSLRTQIKDLERMATASGVTENTVFNKYSNAAKKLNEDLIKTERRLQYLNSVQGNQFGRQTAAKQPSQLTNGLAGIAPELMNQLGIPPELMTAISGLSGISAAGLATFGALSAAGIAIVKYSQHAREEAEKRLKIEESIAIAVNKQVLASQEALKNFERQQELATRTRTENNITDNFLQSDSLETLTKRRDLLKKLQTIDPTGDIAKIYDQQIARLNIAIESFSQNRESSQNNNFQQRWDTYLKRQDAERSEFEEKEKRRLDAEKKFQESVKQGKEKAGEFGKVWSETFDGLFAKQYQDNPLATFFLNSDKELKKLRENLKGATPEMKAFAESMFQREQGKIDFGLRLENRMSVFGLQQQANNFRNPFDPNEFKRKEQDFINDYLFNNPNYLFLKREEYDRRQMINPFNTYKSFEEEVGDDILKFSGKALDSPKYRLNKQIEDQYNLLYSGNLTSDQLAIADKQFIALTQGANPLDLDYNVREQAASARDREVTRQTQQFQSDTIQLQRDLLASSQRVEEHQKRLIEAAENGGVAGVESLIRIVDETSTGRVSSTVIKRPTSQDTANHYKV